MSKAFSQRHNCQGGPILVHAHRSQVTDRNLETDQSKPVMLTVQGLSSTGFAWSCVLIYVCCIRKRQPGRQTHRNHQAYTGTIKKVCKMFRIIALTTPDRRTSTHCCLVLTSNSGMKLLQSNALPERQTPHVGCTQMEQLTISREDRPAFLHSSVRLSSKHFFTACQQEQTHRVYTKGTNSSVYMNVQQLV